ncbi:hydro-lyase, Fe-S type, tartrate/fumarate subfamily, alpha subunit [Thermodesulfatator indicus DSM 15286]|uniref:Hydro-lyase, Fe-S type, tartrate/fumarate subfamily, alpha subunit n=1 Tax=Thermodesulfatator indicus (strain DSM 15286 / JCM 11887 / CIR29812) TaxID=667014 RepID=F8AD97_THEID|nr:fumarate hydratase [Thermodesulfatator indicus]AEH44833.1 hydro-lyase, Fe-S type, tartrate/fumarate subfamily, alpha subunit [Thermodesulfatator indicus DSM 15286]
MRQIEQKDIIDKLAEAVEKACKVLPKEVLETFKTAREEEPSSLGKKVFDILLKNASLAQKENLPICQDTGIAVIFVELGEEVKVKNLYEAINQGVAKGYEKGLLRKSVADPLTRKNTRTNTPAIIHLEIVPGDKLKITVLPKGCGSENMSALKMLPPSAGISGIKDFVIDTVKNAGPNPCPPIIVGVGIGGTFEKAAFLAKKALIRPIGKSHHIEKIAELEKELLAEINTLGIGPLGFGGKYTALAVHIETFPTHIASLPVAVNIQCHAARVKTLEI